MSRGPGALQRRVLDRLHKAPEGCMSRRALEERFAGHGRYTSSNLRRALLSLNRMGLVTLQEGPSLDESYVHLPPRVEFLSDEVVTELLRELRARS
jgi:DNA-binding transcriptional ArsR family regulator